MLNKLIEEQLKNPLNGKSDLNKLFYILSNYYSTVIQICSCFITLSDRNSKIACFCQFLSDESIASYWLKLAQNEEANNMLTHNLTEFQLISYYACMDMSTIDHFTVNSDSCLHNVLRCYQLCSIVCFVGM